MVPVSQHFKKTALCLAIGAACTMPAIAAENTTDAKATSKGIERIEITALRRASSVQEAPLNITALDSDVMKDQNITQLADVARWVPGLTVADQGGRSASPIIVRGLNTNSSGPGSDGGTVAVYAGELPLFVDMKLIDIERVEVLIGPQGTLYGAGTLGGAIRYIPNKPEYDTISGSVYGDVASLSESDDLSTEAGFVFNVPLVEDVLALRVAFNQANEAGYIDYNYLVKEPGVSFPDPDWSDSDAVAANITSKKDANSSDITTARIMLGWQPTDDVELNLAYYYQEQEVGGRSITHYQSLADSNPLSSTMGKYESGYRYVEPRETKTELLSLEVTADLGFATLTSATGLSKFDAVGQRDQTDLLIRLDYSYEEFPAFSAFTRELDNSETFTQEVRLVSNAESDLSWIVGAYYNKDESSGDSREYTPGFDQYAVDNWGANQLRPDALEYVSVSNTTVTEQAVFGELMYQATDKLTLTLGARLYDYDVKSSSAIDLPLYYTLFDSYAQDEINLDYKDISAGGDGSLLKLNASYQVNTDLLVYGTVSEGFRVGGSNGVAACPDDIATLDNQNVCAVPDEVLYDADTTTNYELGFKSTWNNNKLHFNAALFHVEWNDPQVSGATLYGQQPITVNALGASSTGVEVSTRVILTDEFKVYATYAFADAKLTADAPSLFQSIDSDNPNYEVLQAFYDGKNGDRLPGSSQHQFSLGATYNTELFNLPLDINYGLTYQSDVYSKVGLRADGEVLPGYALSNMQAKLSDDNWSVTLYVDNMFDKYAFSSVRRDQGDIGLSRYSEMNTNGTDLQRNYGHYLIQPRKVGVRFEYLFDI